MPQNALTTPHRRPPYIPTQSHTHTEAPTPLPCRTLILTTPGTRALLPLLLPRSPPGNSPNADSFYDEQLLLGSILIPGAPLAGNRASSASHPANAGCFLYRALSLAPGSEKENGKEEADMVVVCACNVEVPVEVSKGLRSGPAQ